MRHPAQRAPDGVARLARGDVPVQQPAVRRARVRRAVGRHCSRSSRRRATGEKITVNAPFFNFFTVAFGLPLILLMGVGPVIAWRRASLRSLRPRSASRSRSACVAARPARARLRRRPGGRRRRSRCRCSWPSRSSLEFGARHVGAQGARRRLVARRARVAREPQPAALRRLHRAPRGGHLRDRRRRRDGLLDRARGRLRPGQTMQVRNYTLRFDGVTRRTGANFEERSAVVRGREGRRAAGHAGAGPACVHRPRARPRTRSRSAPTGARGEDLFLILDAARPDGTVKLKVLINPLVNLLWIARAGVRRRRRRRRLARRPRVAPAGTAVRRASRSSGEA